MENNMEKRKKKGWWKEASLERTYKKRIEKSWILA